MLVDLHIHTRASDGRWSAGEVVVAVQEAGIDLFAVADHDTTENVLPTAALAEEAGLGFIPAVEICTRMTGHTYHILGYGIDVEDTALQTLIGTNYHALQSLDGESVGMLIAAGYEVTYEEYEGYENDRSRGGWKALNFMIDRGICTDVHDFFGRLFTADMALRMPDYSPVEEAINVIHGAGGLAVLAHPGHDWGDDPKTLLQTMVGYGLDGLECYSHYHSEEETAGALGFARANNLMITAGSDSHGGFAGRSIGVPRVEHTALVLRGLATDKAGNIRTL